MRQPEQVLRVVRLGHQVDVLLQVGAGDVVAKEAQRCADKVLAAEKARDEYEKEARAAREKTAHFAGQLEALQAQNAKLLEALGKDKGGA